MNLLNRLRFAMKYDFDQEFIIYNTPDQTPMRFLKYADAKEFSDKQIQYRPKVLVAVKEKS